MFFNVKTSQLIDLFQSSDRQVVGDVDVDNDDDEEEEIDDVEDEEVAESGDEEEEEVRKSIN